MEIKQNYGGLDRFRIIAAFLVVAIHTSPLLSFSADSDFFFTRVLARIAVPFFFMVTGQFVLSGALAGVEKASGKVGRYLRKTVFLYGIAILLYIPLGIYAGHYNELNILVVLKMLIFDGTFYHLWYFPACIVGVALVFLLSRFLKSGGLLIVSGVLYVIGLLGDSYFGVIPEGTILYDIYMQGFQIFSYTRNGLFMAPIFLVLGAIMGTVRGDGKNANSTSEKNKKNSKVSGKSLGNDSKEEKGSRTALKEDMATNIVILDNLEKEPGSSGDIQLISKQDIGKTDTEKVKAARLSPIVYAYIGFVFFFLLMTVEAFVLRYFGVQRHDSMYVALVPVMLFFYKVLLSWNIRSSKFLRDAAAWIYILHPAMIVAIRAAARELRLTWLFVDNSLVHYLLVLLLSIGAALGISKMFTLQREARFHRGRAWIELDRNALHRNVDALRSKLPEKCTLMPAIKADAYGHGAGLIARELNSMGVDAFCVACVNEGVKLRKQGIKGEILILGYTHPEQFALLCRHHLIQTVVDYPYAALLNRYGRKIHVHIGIDTGMHRLGERSENIDRICSIFQMKYLVVDGVFTHLCADDTQGARERAYTKQQAEKFEQVIQELKKRGYSGFKVHMQSSYSVFYYPELSRDYARVGIALYGVLSTEEDTDRLNGLLRPVLSLKTRIASVKYLYEGESAGYGLAFTAERDMKIAVLTIGYADGLPRELSEGNGGALVDGNWAPFIGRICMDQAIIDISGIPNVKAGDIAVLIGRSGNMEISACDLAQGANTITNEILSRMGERLERIMV